MPVVVQQLLSVKMMALLIDIQVTQGHANGCTAVIECEDDGAID